MGMETAVNGRSLPTLLSKGSSLQSTCTVEVKPKTPVSYFESPAPPEIPSGSTLQRSLQAFAQPDKSGPKVSKAQSRSDSSSNVGKTGAWRNAAKMVGQVGVWKKGRSSFDNLSEERISDVELAELHKLESILLTDYQTIAAAFQVCTADKACFTEIDLRYALSQHRTQEEIMRSSGGPNSIPLGDVPRLFASLCSLLKYEDGAIPKRIFLMFSDRLRCERLQRLRIERSGQVRANEAPIEGSRLLQLLSKGAKTPESAKKLINQVAAAVRQHPQETAKALLRSTKTSGGTNAGIRHVIKLMRQHGSPVSGIPLDILISGWAVCCALTQSAVVLGTLESPGSLHRSSSQSGRERKKKHSALATSAIALGTLVSSSTALKRFRKKATASHHGHAKNNDVEVHHEEPMKFSVAAKVAIFGTRLIRKIPGSKRKQYHCKVSSSGESNEEGPSHLWQMLPPGEVLHCLRGGSKTLDGEDFQKLLEAAWSLFDECDVVSWLIEPKAESNSRALQLLVAQEELAEVVSVNLKAGQLALDPEQMHQRLVKGRAVIYQLKDICDGADDGLLRRAALYGLPILLERMSIWVHASVDQITNQTISNPSRAAAHEMDNQVAIILDAFTPYEVAVEDGLGYEVPLHSCDAFLSSRSSSTGGAAVVSEEAWKRFLRSREDDQRSKLDARTEETKEHSLDSTERFCTHKLLTPGF